MGGWCAWDPQVRWLKTDLADNRRKCTQPLWKALYAASADVVLNGHDHNYQRFAPQNPGGEADPERGIREFVAGTGGRSHYPILAPIANSEVHNDDTYGILKLTLRPQGYDWRFVPVEGETFTDNGSASVTDDVPERTVDGVILSLREL